MKNRVLLGLLALALFSCNNNQRGKQDLPEECQGDEWIIPEYEFVCKAIQDSLILECNYIPDTAISSNDDGKIIPDTGYVRYHNTNDSCGVAVKDDYIRTLLLNSRVVRYRYDKRVDELTWETEKDATIKKVRVRIMDDYGLLRSEIYYKDLWYKSEYDNPELKDLLRATGLSEESLKVVGDFVEIAFPVANKDGQLDHIGYNHSTYRVWDIITLYAGHPLKQGVECDYGILYRNNCSNHRLEIVCDTSEIPKIIFFKGFTIRKSEDIEKIMTVLWEVFPNALEVPVVDGNFVPSEPE